MARALTLVAFASLIALSGCYSPYYADRYGYRDRYGYYHPGYYDRYYSSGYGDEYRGYYGRQYRDGGDDRYRYDSYDRDNPYVQNQYRANNPKSGYSGPQANPDYPQ
jgi:hypothetical protein